MQEFNMEIASETECEKSVAVEPAEPPLAPPFWRAPWMFAVHAVVGIAIFGIIAVAAVLLDLGVRKLKAYQAGPAIILGLEAAEYLVFSIDLFLFALFLFRNARRAAKLL